MGKYIAPRKVPTGRVSMATKHVIIDMNVDVTVPPEQIEQIENDVAAALHIEELRSEVDELKATAATKEELDELDYEILEVSLDLDDLTVRVENLEEGGITPADKQEIINEVIDELHAEGITPINFINDSENEDLIIDKGVII